MAHITISRCPTCHSFRPVTSADLLRNPSLPPAPYARNDPATTAGTTYPEFNGDNTKGPTARCLSCHDGLIASHDGMWVSRQAFAGTSLVDASAAPGDRRNIARLTQSLVETHPIAMPYPFGNAPSSYNLVKNGGTDYAGWVADPTVRGIRLYNEDADGRITHSPVTDRTGIECSSCHEVHNDAA